MRANSFQLIKLCCTRTDPAAETKSVGLQADARVVMVFASPSGQFYRDTKYSSTYRDFAKTHANPDTDGNKLNRRAVRFHSREPTDYLPFRKFAVTQKFRPLIGTQPSTNFYLT